jgi:hypothetical protein
MVQPARRVPPSGPTPNADSGPPMLGHPEPDHVRAITRLASPSDNRAESAIGLCKVGVPVSRSVIGPGFRRRAHSRRSARPTGVCQRRS